jgi:general secretion pathway protein L
MTSAKWATRTAESSRSRQGSVGRALDWWCEGLAAALARLAGAVRPTRRFQLRTAAAPFVLNAMNARAGQVAIRLSDTPQSGVPAEVLQQTRGSVIEVTVPPAAILERRLDPLPSESRPYVESVIQHRLEAMLPWPAADVLREVDIRERDDGLLDVSVRATARPAIAQALALAAACGARAVVVTADGSGSTGSIYVPMGTTNFGALRVARSAVVGLLALVAVVAGWSAYAHWSLTLEVAALDEAIAGRRAALKRAADQRDRAGATGLDARKSEAVIAVAVMEALSAILPDDTYLTELSLDGGRVRISGVSARATEIVPLLEGSGKFKNAAFYAPTTRTAGRGADRFSIEAVVVTPWMQVTP